VREFFPCPECGEDVDLDWLEEGGENDYICECGCEFECEVLDGGEVVVNRIFVHNRKTEESICRVEMQKYLDSATSSLFPDVPPWREIINAG
jgi:hypothetical protein